MKLYDGGATIIIIVLGLAFAYIAGVENWAYHCKPGGLEPKGCPKQTATETKTR